MSENFLDTTSVMDLWNRLSDLARSQESVATEIHYLFARFQEPELTQIFTYCAEQLTQALNHLQEQENELSQLIGKNPGEGIPHLRRYADRCQWLFEQLMPLSDHSLRGRIYAQRNLISTNEDT